MFLKTFHTSMLKDSSRVDQTNSLLDNQPKLGLAFLRSRWTSNISNGFHDSSYASKILHDKFQALQVKFPQTVAQMVENQLYWSKVNCGQHTVKTSDFWSTSSFLSYIHHLIKG